MRPAATIYTRPVLLAILAVALSFGVCLASPVSAPVKPADLREHPLGGTAPLPIRIGLYVTDLAAVDEASESFEIQGYLYATWQDERFIDKSAPTADKPKTIDPANVWNPSLDIENLRSFKSFRQEFFVYPDGNVFWEEHFDAILSTEFYLRRFPFDAQSLYVIIQPAISPSRSNRELVDFAPESYVLGISSDTYLAAWEIKGIHYLTAFAPTDMADIVVPRARFGISVKRRSGFYLWQVFLPTILMAMIPWSVFWIKPDEFDWQMKIPLTVMLAMIAFDFAISRDLPRVNYLTFLDSVLLTSFVFAFLAVVETLVVHILIQRDQHSLAERLYFNARWIAPLTYGVVLLLQIALFFTGSGRPS